MMKRKGVFYTLGILLLIIPLIVFTAYYATTKQTKSDDTIKKIRCDELHYFIEDIRMDLQRALIIFGRRATIYAIDDVIKSGKPLTDYTFNCSAACNIDCSKFRFPVNGSEAAIAELTTCGTLHGQNITYMTNHTLSQWLGRIRQQGQDMHFNVTIQLRTLTIAPQDPWDFMMYANTSFNVFDEAGACFYEGDNVVTSSQTSIIGLEDPLYPLNTNAYVVKFITNCSAKIITEAVSGCSGDISDPGFGTGTGSVVFKSDIDPKEYCVGEPPELINNQILVLDGGFGGCNSFEEAACFNLSHPNHFAAIVDYAANDPNSFTKKCNVTIPWLRATGDMDNVTPRSPPRAVEACNASDIYDGACVTVLNDEDCGKHEVVLSSRSDGVNTTCYQRSNASLYGLYDGPSFFDRLDGRLNLSEKYRNQSYLFFNNTLIGLETLVNPYDLSAHGVTPKTNVSWVDYLYWSDIPGCDAQGVCRIDEYTLKFDDPHARIYEVNTECVNATTC